MAENHSMTWVAVTQPLKNAALFPHQRDELIAHALQEILTGFPAAGAALIRPARDGNVLWKVQYAGIRQPAMRRWIAARIDPSIDVIMGAIQHDHSCSPAEMLPPLLMRLHTPLSFCRGLWIVWPLLTHAGLDIEYIERIRQMLEAVLEVEDREEQYFSTSSPVYDRELIAALAHGDTRALPAFLSLTRVLAQADFTFWGKAYQDVVEITSHLGARHSGFGFALQRGHGVGGRVAAYGTMVLGDYRNSPYRDPSVSDIVDGEQVRSGMALPVRYNTARDTSAHVAAVLYATRRTATHFSLAECLLVQRMVRLLEPLPLEIRSPSFFLPNVSHPSAQKAAWYDLVLHANRVEAVEAWASQLVKGAVIVTDGDGYPYVFAHSEQLEQMKANRASQPETTQIISLTAPGVQSPGQIYLCPTVPLPPPQWPDFFDDLILACNLIIARMKQTLDQVDRQREQWLHALLQGRASPHVEQDGYRLGLPIEHGQVWVIAWQPETMQATKSVRKRMIAESVVLDNLKSPLMFLDDSTGVVLLEGQTPTPSKVRDALLRHCDPHPLWIVHGARYRSFHDLNMALTHAITIAQRARQERHGEYLLDVYTFGLDSLLENPRLTDELDTFALRLLTPLIEYDAANKSHLTETFVLAQTLGSAQAAADHLAVHVNTIRYRLHKVEDILGAEQPSPKENTALALAAFIWKRFHMEKSL